LAESATNGIGGARVGGGCVVGAGVAGVGWIVVVTSTRAYGQKRWIANTESPSSNIKVITRARFDDLNKVLSNGRT